MPTLTPRSGILNIKPHMIATPEGHALTQSINVSSNENALGPSEHASAAAHAALDTIERYPEDGAMRLVKAIGEAFDLDPQKIVCGHGSDELLQRLSRAYLNPGDELIHSVHGYLKFPNYAHAMGARPVAAPDNDFCASVDAILSCVTARTRMVLLANPDNPTGTCLSGSEIRRLHAGLPEDTLLVLDSAYAEYVTAADYEIPTKLINESQNVVMTRTFSKIFGLAGMRLGWAYGPGAVIDVLKRLSMTFPVSAPAVAAGIAALADKQHVARTFAANREVLQSLTEQLTALGLYVYPSNTNFALIRFDNPLKTAQAAYDYLFARGIVARRFNSPAYENTVRVTIGLKAEIDAVIAALTDFVRG